MLHCELNSDRIIVSGQLLNTTVNWQTVAYPTGFSATNCFISGVKVDDGNTKISCEYLNNTRVIEYHLHTNYIMVKACSSDVFGFPFEILLERV